MKKIESIKDLKSERARLKLELNVAEENLREDFEWIKTELKPVHVAGKFLSNTLINKDHGVMNHSVREILDVVLKSVVLSKSGWITKLIVPYVVKNITSNYILEKKPEIFGMLKNIFSKARKNINHNHNGHYNNDSAHFDKSTADEMEY